MNEEAAFIGAIVAAPADDTNRLVYADWLDERDDGRGAYLRAEVKWAKSRDARAETRVRKLAERLDRVWCARVSRPPLGVCAWPTAVTHPQHVNEVLDRLERRFGIVLSADYRAYLINYNGRLLGPCELRIPSRRYRGEAADVVTVLHGVHSTVDVPPLRRWEGNDWNPDLVFCLLEQEYFRAPARLGGPYRRYAEYWTSEPHCNLMPIGYGDPNGQNEVYCLGVRGEQLGKVYYDAGQPDHDCDDGDCISVADNFAAFLAMLTSYRKPKPTVRKKPKQT